MPITYDIVGPTSGVKGVAQAYAVAPSGTTTDTITLSATGGATLSTSTLTFASSSTPQFFNLTAPSPGTYALTATSGNGDTVTDSPLTFTATPAYVWSKIQSNVASNNSEPFQQVAFGSSVTKGNLIIVAVTLGSNETPTISDTLGSSYTAGVVVGNMGIWYTVAGSSGPLTVTVAVGSNTGITVAIGEYFYPPGATLSLEHTETGSTGSSSTAVSITSIPVTNPDLVVMAVNLANTTVTSVTAGSPMSTVEYTPGGGGQPGIQFQEVISPLTSPVTSTATLAGGAAYWTAVSGAFLAAMPTYSILGPSSVASGSPATFELVPTGTIASDVVTLSDGGFGGTFSPTTLTFTSSSLAQPFTYTPSHSGLVSISPSSSHGFTFGPFPWALGSYVPFTLSGPTGGTVGVASAAFTLTPSSTTTDVVTFSDGGAGGTFSPTSLTWTSSSAAKTFTYTAASSGTNAITPTSQDGAPIGGSPFSFFASGVVLTNYVAKSGTLFMFGTASADGLSNGAWPLANITAVNATPVIKVNGNVVSIGPGTWSEVDHDTCFVAYLARCGSVRSIPMSIAGGNYTSPSATWNGDGGGSGHTVGTPILGVGVTAYSFSGTAGSGLSNGSFQWQVPGGTFTNSFFHTPATAYVTVSGGSVVSVVPMNGAVQGMGAAYDPTVTSFTASYGNATITCTVSKYIQSVPVTNPGSGFTSPPTYTFTDGTGGGAVAAPIMNGPASTDTCTYTVADGWLTTTLGPVLGATNGALQNFVGQLEGPNGNLSGFLAPPTLKMGGQFCSGSTNSQAGYLFFGKNKLKCADIWKASSGTSSFTLDSNYFPVSWTPGGTLKCQFYADASGSGCGAAGTWTLVYDDEFYASPSRAPAATSVFLTGAGSQTSSTVSGTTVTITYSYSLPGQIDFSDIEFNVVAPSDGLWHLKDQSGNSDPWVFAPGNSIDRSKPFAADDALVAALTGPGGSMPACIRVMDVFGSSGGWQNWISGSDFPATTLFSYSVPYATIPAGIPTVPPFSGGNPLPSGTSIFQFARFLNTDASNATYAWSSPRIYSTDGWANSGTDSFGNYLDLTASSNGASDNGSFLTPSGPDPNSGILELRSTSPHGLRSRQLVSLFIDTGGANIPWTGGFGTLPFLYPNPGGAGALLVYVTGPNTIIFTYGIGTGGTGSATQTVNSTTEVAVNIAAQVSVPQSDTTMPIEALAGAVASFSGANPPAAWVNLPQIGDDSIYTTMAQKIAANIGPNNDVILEFGNEHWNFGAAFHEFPNEIVAKNLGRYMPTGKTLYGYFPTNGGNIATDGTNDLFYTVKAAHSYDVFIAAWVAAGLSSSRVKRIFGQQWTSSGGVEKTAGYFTTYGIAADGICVAPYQPLNGRNNNGSPVAAYTTAGYPGYPSGNWPVDAMNDYLRHTTFYNTDNWNVWGSQFPSLPSGVRMYAYESGYDYVFPDSIPFAPQLTEDCLYHSSYYDALYCYELAIQQGSPLVANSGVVMQSYFNLWNAQSLGMPEWRLGAGFSQPYGRGTSNSFITPQGGLAQSNSATGVWPEGYATINEQPGLQLLRDWNAATSGGGATGYTFSGPSTGTVGVAATLTITPNASVTDTVTLSDSGAGGSFSPSATVTFTSSSAAQHPTYTPSATGTKTITATSTAGGVVSGSPLSITVSGALSYTLSGAFSGFDGVPITLTITPSGVATDTVTLSDSSGGGSFSPSATLTFSSSSAAQHPTYTPGSTGTKSVTATSTAGDTVSGSPLSITVAARGYVVTGVTTGFVGNAIAYTVTPSGATTDTVTFSDSSGGGSFSPTSLTWSDTSNAQTVHYTPGSAGSKTLTFISGDGGTVFGSPLSLSVSLVGYLLTGPTSGTTGNVLTYTVTPDALAIDTITIAHTGSTGTLSTTTLTFAASATPQAFTFTPSAAGTGTLTAASSDGGTIAGSPITLTVSVVTHAKAARYMPAGRPKRIKGR